MTNDAKSRLPMILTAFAIALAVVGLVLAGPADAAVEKTIYVAPYQQECSDGTLCLLASATRGGAPEPLSGQIEGFNYEWGFTYELRIEERTVEAAPPYALIQIVDKTPVAAGTVFEIALTGTSISDEGDGLYEFYGQHFACPNPDVHDILADLIGTDEKIPFKLRFPDRDARPLALVSFLLPGATGWAAPTAGAGDSIPSDADPYIEGGRTLVPLRAIFEWLGADVKYNSAAKRITATRGDNRVEIEIGNTVGHVDGETVRLDAPPEIKGSRTFVPMRFVAEALGAEVGWDAATRTVSVMDGGRVGTLQVP